MGTHRFESRGVFGNEHACVWNTSRLLEYKCAKCKIKNRLVLSADKECKLAVRLFFLVSFPSVVSRVLKQLKVGEIMGGGSLC